MPDQGEKRPIFEGRVVEIQPDEDLLDILHRLDREDGQDRDLWRDYQKEGARFLAQRSWV